MCVRKVEKTKLTKFSEFLMEVDIERFGYNKFSSGL